jgi:predicted nucleic acid-binding protein
MSFSVVFLDAGPLSEVTRPPGKNQEADAFRHRLQALTAQGIVLCVAEITDYEVRREFIRTGRTTSLTRLDAFIATPGRYVPMATPAIREAARLWAQARNAGTPPAPPEALDADVILCAQVQDFCFQQGILLEDVVIATTNMGHLDQFIPVEHWQSI